MKKIHMLAIGLLLASGGAAAQFSGDFFVQGQGYGQTAQEAAYHAQYNTLIQCAMRGVGGHLTGAVNVNGGNGHYHASATGVCSARFGTQPELPY